MRRFLQCTEKHPKVLFRAQLVPPSDDVAAALATRGVMHPDGRVSSISKPSTLLLLLGSIVVFVGNTTTHSVVNKFVLLLAHLVKAHSTLGCGRSVAAETER